MASAPRWAWRPLELRAHCSEGTQLGQAQLSSRKPWVLFKEGWGVGIWSYVGYPTPDLRLQTRWAFGFALKVISLPRISGSLSHAAASTFKDGKG